MEELRYPIGKFAPKESYTSQEIKDLFETIEAFPLKLENEVKSLSSFQLDTPYRDGGWTVRQVIHHLADSHTHAYVRVKWTLTEDAPVIKAYLEKLWAETPENTSDPDVSINLLKALHAKWGLLLRNISTEQLQRYFIHPETKRQIRIDTLIAMYAWHGNHHLAHITSLKSRMNW